VKQTHLPQTKFLLVHDHAHHNRHQHKQHKGEEKPADQINNGKRPKDTQKVLRRVDFGPRGSRRLERVLGVCRLCENRTVHERNQPNPVALTEPLETKPAARFRSCRIVPRRVRKSGSCFPLWRGLRRRHRHFLKRVRARTAVLDAGRAVHRLTPAIVKQRVDGVDFSVTFLRCRPRERETAQRVVRVLHPAKRRNRLEERQQPGGRHLECFAARGRVIEHGLLEPRPHEFGDRARALGRKGFARMVQRGQLFGRGVCRVDAEWYLL
jgi:hypothetical protein